VCKEGGFTSVFGGKSVSGNSGSCATLGWSVIGFSPLLKKWFRDDSILDPGENPANSGVSQ
jgi:hypothetical protein